MAKVTIKTAYDKKPGATVDTGKGLTEQSHKDATDMNFILKDYHRTGLIKHAEKNKGRYDDVSVQDFQEAMFKITEAQSMFDSLPGNMRKRFGNDPAAFLDYVHNPENLGEMKKMGMLVGNDGIDVSGAQTGAPVTPAPKQGIVKPGEEAPGAPVPADQQP